MSGQDPHRRENDGKQLNTVIDELTLPDGFDSSLDLEEILTTTCRAAVELVKVHHSGLMIFDSDYRHGEVISEYPPIGTKGLSIPLRGVPAEERMINFKEPLPISDISLDPSFSPVSDVLQKHGIRSVLIVPLISKDTLIGSLGLDMISDPRTFTDDQISLCQVFAKQAAAVIDLFKQNRRKAEQLAAIKNTAQVLSGYDNLRTILDTIIKQAVELVGGTAGGIKQFNPERGEMTVIAAYNFPQLIGSTITLWEGLAGEVIRKDIPYKAVPDYEKYPERAPVYAETELFGAVLMINLKWQNRTMGVLFINAEPHHRFPTELPPLLILLASTAAIAIANSRLLHESQVARARIGFSYEATHAFASLPNSERVLQDIAEQALQAADGSWVRLIMLDEQKGTRKNFLASRDDHMFLRTDDRIRPDGISHRVLKTGKPCLIEDVTTTTEKLNPAMLEEGSKAAMCLPLSFVGGQLGVIWIHYSSPRTFSRLDVPAIETYLQQASMAYNSARQMEELEPLRRVAEHLAVSTDTKDVLQRIVAFGRELMHADYAVFWPCVEGENEAISKLSIRDAVIDGVDPALLHDMRDATLPVAEVTRRVLREGWFSVTSDDAAWKSLPDISLKLLTHLNIKSFEGLALLAGDEKLGVVYLGHHDSHLLFDKARKRRALAFATHAALALKKARLVEQIATGQMLARRAAELTALVALEETLNSIVATARQIFGCDAVTLFVYNEETRRFLPLTIMTGVSEMKLASYSEERPDSLIVSRMLERDEPYRVESVAKDELFRNQLFSKREQIESVCAIPLKVETQRVGVMFLNYRSPHTFPDHELKEITHYTDIWARTILARRNDHEQTARLLQQQLLIDLSKKLLGARSLKESLDLAIKNAKELLQADFVAIILKDTEGLIKVAESWGWTQTDKSRYEEGKNSPEHRTEEENQTEYTMKTGEAVIVKDYDDPSLPFKVPTFVISKKIKCGISVPMLNGDKRVGAMLVHYLKKRPLDDAQARELILISNLTAIAAQHHQAVDSKIELLSAVINASDEISKIRLGTNQRDVLNTIIESAVHCLPQSFLGTIQTYDRDMKTLRLESVFSTEPREDDDRQIETERRLDRRDQGTIGITGLAVLNKEPQLVPDVFEVGVYFNYHEGTRSELAVPILDESGDEEPGEVLGVLNVESKHLAAFGEDDKQALIVLAKLAGTTIQNAEQYRLLEGSSLLAWFGMASSVWGHTIAANALDISKNIAYVRRKLEGRPLEPFVRRLLDDNLDEIANLAVGIQSEPMIALLHQSEGISDVELNTLITDRLRQLWHSTPYKHGQYELALTNDNTVVRGNQDWIIRMLDLLIDNAFDAISDPNKARITVSTKLIGSQVEMTITDNGPGIPRDLQQKLFKQRIEKGPSSKGLGLGLLMVQVIAHVYRGKVGIAQTGKTGTTMYVRLPVVLNGLSGT